MGIEKMIEGLKKSCWGKSAHVVDDERRKAATALSTLQAENEKLRAELEQVKRALAMMWYAYENKDSEFPHEYEIESRRAADKILGPWSECMPKYLRRGPQEED